MEFLIKHIAEVALFLCGVVASMIGTLAIIKPEISIRDWDFLANVKVTYRGNIARFFGIIILSFGAFLLYIAYFILQDSPVP